VFVQSQLVDISIVSVLGPFWTHFRGCALSLLVYAQSTPETHNSLTQVSDECSESLRRRIVLATVCAVFSEPTVFDFFSVLSPFGHILMLGSFWIENDPHS
jgi:hypothetical protein